MLPRRTWSYVTRPASTGPPGSARERRLERSIEDFIRHEESRRDRAPAGERLTWRDGKTRARSKPEWTREVRRILKDRRGLTTKIIADGWAYRTYVIGQYLAAKAAGLRRINVLRAHATIDGRTTQFCRWIHRRVIRIENVDRKLEEYRVAISNEDRELADRLWPMTPPKGNFTDLARHFVAGVGLPPYHYRCRTIVQAGVVAV